MGLHTQCLFNVRTYIEHDVPTQEFSRTYWKDVMIKQLFQNQIFKSQFKKRDKNVNLKTGKLS